ncbi:hypothetical protein B9Z55_007696 [Caenorhabditis nigoni]|nr:hypothetical protein B9Z55_007696 [Caenorhabditis nigoni]
MDKEDNHGKEPTYEILLKSIQFLVERAEKVNKENQQKFDQLSDRLQSIEASISKLSKFNVDARKSKDDARKEPITEKSFKLKHVFNVNRFMNGMHSFSESEDHFNVKWRMCVERRNNRLEFYVYCDPIAPPDQWSIRTRTECKLFGRYENDVSRSWENYYEKSGGLGIDFLTWEDMRKKYLVDGKLTVETKVTIVETTGWAKPKIRVFDESQKDVSDVILVASDTKFYVLKMFLSSQSSVFKALLLGSISESKQSEVKLDVSDPDDFHYFLEVLHGEPAIDDTNVEGVALLADMYDAPTVIRRCQEFLLEKSKKTVEKKREIANQYHLGKVEKTGKSGTTTHIRNHADLPEPTLSEMLMFIVVIMLIIWWKFG